MKHFISQALTFLLFQHIFSMSEIETLLNLVNCLDQTGEFNKTQIMTQIDRLNNYNPFKIKMVYDFLGDNLYLVNHCSNDLEDLPETIKGDIIPYNKMLAKYNWVAYLNCLLYYYKRDSSLKYLINLIISKSYYDAMKEEHRLLIEGVEAVLLCSKKKDEGIFNLGMCPNKTRHD